EARHPIHAPVRHLSVAGGGFNRGMGIRLAAPGIPAFHRPRVSPRLVRAAVSRHTAPREHIHLLYPRGHMKHSYFVLPAVVFLLSLLQLPAAISGSPTPVLQQQESPSAPAAVPAVTPQPPTQQSPARRVTAYTLPPELYKKAHDLGRIHFRFNLISFFYGLVVLWVVLAGKLAAKFRTWAETSSPRRFLQAVIFSCPLLVTMSVLGLPADIYEQHVERAYGLSIQGWGSWSWDWVKLLLISLVIGTILIWILYGVIRKSPRRWWFYFWLATLPIGLFLVFLAPVVIDPMFHKF